MAMRQLGGPISWPCPHCCGHGTVELSLLMIISLLAWPGDGWVVPSRGHVPAEVVWLWDSWVVLSLCSLPGPRCHGHELVGWSFLMAMSPSGWPGCGTVGWSPVPSDVLVPTQASSSGRCTSRRRTARSTP